MVSAEKGVGGVLGVMVGDWSGAGLTSLLDFVPHLFDFAVVDLGCGGVEAADFVVFFVGADGVGEGFVLRFGHLVFGHGGEGR